MSTNGTSAIKRNKMRDGSNKTVKFKMQIKKIKDFHDICLDLSGRNY